MCSPLAVVRKWAMPMSIPVTAPHRLLAQFRPGTPMARRVGTRQAYDALLVEACDAVDVEQRLDQMPEGLAREVERLRLEESLRSAGLAIP